MKTIFQSMFLAWPVWALLAFTACNPSNGVYDASGSFETREIVVSAEASGKIMQFQLHEGMDLDSGQLIGIIDTLPLTLKKQQLEASIRAVQSRRPDIGKQLAALEQQVSTARSERARVEKLLKANAASSKQLDDLNAQIAVLEKQLAATRSSLESTDRGMLYELDALKFQFQQLDDQLQKCRIVSPAAGTVLTRYAEAGEVALPGKALFRMGDTREMTLRAYFTADQTTRMKIGDPVKVFADFGAEGNREYEGRINWIASRSEFTPKTIQTRDERANLVYAVKIGVPNDGYLKIGMYGQVTLNHAAGE